MKVDTHTLGSYVKFGILDTLFKILAKTMFIGHSLQRLEILVLPQLQCHSISHVIPKAGVAVNILQ